MGKVRRPYPEEFKLQMVELVRAGKTPEELSREFEPTAQSIHTLVLWRTSSESVRFVEVKCPHWDRPSQAQLEFHAAAQESGCLVDIVEWEFDRGPP